MEELSAWHKYEYRRAVNGILLRTTDKIRASGGRGREGTHVHVLLTVAGAGGSCPRGVRRSSERSRRSERSAEDGAERHTDADNLPRFSPSPRQLPLYSAQIQIFPVQPPPEQRHAHCAQGLSPGRGKKRTDAGVAARWQGEQRRRS
eukprot:3537366-Pleurochrysis_carterae.AAC.5